ncbi:MAG TPA: hypothetical protein VM597_08195 [Gemmataceae bacterium]|jgi:hypothetical protein|nr:hypothetical protein [Gemmataceae bacterium]
MITRERLRNWLSALGWIAIFLAVMPYFHHRTGPVSDAAAEFIRDQPDLYPSTSVYRFGWTNSPLVEYVSEQTVEAHGSSGFTFKRASAFHVGWLSWSMLTLVVGVVLLRASRRPKPPSTPASDRPTGERAP